MNYRIMIYWCFWLFLCFNHFSLFGFIS